MAKFDVESFLESLVLEEGAGGVDEAFNALSAKLPAEEYKAAVNAIEDQIVGGVQQQIDDLGVPGMKAQLIENARYYSSTQAQTSAQLFLHIGKEKGDAASPFVKAFIRAAEKLTDEEYNSSDCLTKPMLAAVGAFGGALKQNPFRPKSTPPQ